MISPEQRKDFDAFLEALRKLEKTHVADTIDGRRRQSDRFKRAFQISGAVVILCSVSIPFIAAIAPEALPAKNVVISFIALLIAAITSLTSFFAWGDAWQSHRQAHYSLVRLHSLWELKLVEASHMDDYLIAKETMITATRELFETTGMRMDSLLDDYFKKAGKQLPSPPNAA